MTTGAVADRLTLEEVPLSTPAASFAEDVRRGLTAQPKWLSCRFFYDDAGSDLFEQVCDLPEYYLTRAEQEILAEHGDEITGALPRGTELVELGSGSAAKTRRLIEALLRRQGALRYVPIDISRGMLLESARRLLDEYPTLAIRAVAAEYRDGLCRLQLSHLSPGPHPPQLILWLGSNVGNFERSEAAACLAEVRAAMGPADRLLLGVDLRKDRAVLEPAYDDAQGVTARFNKNLLVRINRELGGHFVLDRFAHRAVYDEAAGRVEMFLVSRRDQTVPVDGLRLRVPFAAGEAVHTESSRKYSFEEIEALAGAAGFAVERHWLDGGRRFCESLLRPA